MNSGLFSALSGNVASMQRLDVLANNLANAGTAGFKRDRILFESVLASVNNPTQTPGILTDAPPLSGLVQEVDYSAGALKQTGNTFDLALDGNGFFVVNTPNGKAYTRQGSFRLDAGGRLVTSEGYEVQGGGPIVVAGGRLEIDAEGKVLVDGGQVGLLEIVDFPKPYQLQKTGSSLFLPANPQAVPRPASGAVVKQGYLEESNVSPVLEMVQLIETSRYFEACSKAVKAYDDMAGKAANEMGKV